MDHDSIQLTLQQFLTSAGLCCSSASQVLGVHKSTLSRWRNGKSTQASWQWPLAKQIIESLEAANHEHKVYKKLVGKQQQERVVILQDVLKKLA